MKKQNIITAILISIASIGYAQENIDETDFRETLRFGIKVGMNYANVYNESGDKFVADPKYGFVGGVQIAIPISKYLGLQPEVLYSQKGFNAKGSLLGSEYSFRRTTSYLDIPIQLALKPSEFLSILGGFQYSYLLKQKDEFTSTSTSFIQEQEFKQDNIRKNIFGFVGGVDLNLKQFTIGARLGWDLSKNNGDGSSSNIQYKNKWTQATIAYCF